MHATGFRGRWHASFVCMTSLLLVLALILLRYIHVSLVHACTHTHTLIHTCREPTCTHKTPTIHPQTQVGFRVEYFLL